MLLKYIWYTRLNQYDIDKIRKKVSLVFRFWFIFINLEKKIIKESKLYKLISHQIRCKYQNVSNYIEISLQIYVQRSEKTTCKINTHDI